MTDQTRSHPMCWRGDHYEHDCARPSGRTCIDCGAPAGTLGRSIARERDLDLLAIRQLLAEVRRLWAMEQRVREYARHLARPFADGVPDREGEQIASEVLAALDGGE